MLVSDFHYDLPEDLIAQQPPAVRGASRMLALDRRSGAFADHTFRIRFRQCLFNREINDLTWQREWLGNRIGNNKAVVQA